MTRLSRTKQDFWKLDNDEQVAELTERMVKLQKDYDKFSDLLRQKYFIDHYSNAETEELKKSYDEKPLVHSIIEVKTGLRTLIPYMGRYSK